MSNGGGLLQLVAYGAQDVFLSGNPQINFFKTSYKRYTNFSMARTISSNNYHRKYANFEIKMNIDSNDLDLELDMIFPTNINLRNLNKTEIVRYLCN